MHIMNNAEHLIESRYALGKRVKELRREQQLTQTQLALMVGLDHSYISRIENGECNPTVDSIVIIANGLGTSPSTLFEGIGIPIAQNEPHDPLAAGQKHNRAYSAVDA